MEQGNANALTEARLAVLSTFNIDLLPPYLTASLVDAGIYPNIYLGGLNQFAQEILDESSELYKFDPEGVLLITELEDLFPALYASPARYDALHQEAEVDERLTWLRSLVERLCERLPGAAVYLTTPPIDRVPCPAVLHIAAPERGSATMERFVAGIREWPESSQVIVVDWDRVMRVHGSQQLRDDRLWYLGRMRLSPEGLAAISDLVAQHIAAYTGSSRKVLAVDLDNTLWGGVVGEEGLHGLELGQEGLGLAYHDLQRELLKLHDLGFVLVICSKNNPEDAWEVFDEHPGMVLSRENVAAARINWEDKAKNLEDLAEELNLGLDSFVFLDDSPVEREWVRTKSPEIAVPELPDDPARRPAFLRDLPAVRRLRITSDDRKRTERYRAQGQRGALRSKTTSLEEFLTSLDQEAHIEAVGPLTIERAAQMCQRTNQFNLTTRRHTTAALQTMLEDTAVEMYVMSVRDRFGDNGITGLAILRFDGDSAEIDSFLLSCRILARRAEDLLLAFLADQARTRGAHWLIGEYIPTKKNHQVEDFYPSRSFLNEDRPGRYRLDLTGTQLAYPLGICLKSAAVA